MWKARIRIISRVLLFLHLDVFCVTEEFGAIPAGGSAITIFILYIRQV